MPSMAAASSNESSMYNSYATTHEDSVTEIRKGIQALKDAKAGGNNAPDGIATTLHRHFRDAEKTLKSMEMECKTLSGAPEERKERRDRCRQLQRDLKSLSDEFDIQIQGLHRNGLLGTAANQRAIQRRLMETEKKIEYGTDMLRQANQMAAETEEIGADIMRDLSDQREVIERTRGNMKGVGQELGQASGTIKELEKPWWRMW